MIRTTLCVVLLAPGLAQAVICKTVDAEGVVSYADVPAAECPQAIKLPDYSRYAPREIPSSAPAQPTAQGGAAEPQAFTGYRSIQIVQPEANGTVRNNQGTVQVAIAFDPSLQEGHRIKLYLDGGAVPGEFNTPSVELSDVDRGTHSLRAVVSSASGKRLGDSPSVRFTLRRTTRFDRARNEPDASPDPQPNPPDAPDNPFEPPPAAPEPDQPSGNNPFAPPAGGGVPSTPGTTNPAYTPNFNP